MLVVLEPVGSPFSLELAKELLVLERARVFGSAVLSDHGEEDCSQEEDCEKNDTQRLVRVAGGTPVGPFALGTALRHSVAPLCVGRSSTRAIIGCTETQS